MGTIPPVVWVALVVGSAIVLANLVLLACYGARMLAVWRELMLRQPVLIIESDDWGAGSAEQAAALQRISRLLRRFTDKQGRHPVMTLGVVLSSPDFKAIRSDAAQHYHAITLADPSQQAVMDAMLAGMAAGVLIPQLHGMAHYWPEALMQAARQDDTVRKWLLTDLSPRTEQLPAAIQSRWVDASSLPAAPLDAREIEDAAQAEAALFATLFGQPAKVAVPPTFVWTDQVEQAWQENGVGIVVTPGCQYVGRGPDGELLPGRRDIVNGQRSPCALMYMVRDVYFEPARGHQVEPVLDALKERTSLGRPTLIETHRFNFLDQPQQSLHALEQLFTRAQSQFPDLRFVSTEQLAGQMASASPEWLVTDNRERVLIWCRRLRHLSGFRRRAMVTGLWCCIIALEYWVRRLQRNHSPTYVTN